MKLAFSSLASFYQCTLFCALSEGQYLIKVLELILISGLNVLLLKLVDIVVSLIWLLLEFAIHFDIYSIIFPCALRKHRQDVVPYRNAVFFDMECLQKLDIFHGLLPLNVKIVDNFLGLNLFGLFFAPVVLLWLSLLNCLLNFVLSRDKFSLTGLKPYRLS